jgi:5-oxopent-3-ene-1,2,5-tricarboxylate decarboxylase/2-hydroxyhepta-2,4-diene-1,7-dioate isomerase
MRYARVRNGEGDHDVIVESPALLRLADGRVVPESEVAWLPPRHGTLFALGLNYADHASELEFKAPEEPLIFIKAASSLVGHKQHSLRPAGVEYMHYEAELVAVIGRAARNVNRSDAMQYIGGYTVCNDYAVRDYLENYFRPGLRVKSRDTLTPLGPWVVDAADVPDPSNLAVRTWVNGELRQEGNTRDMIFTIPVLVEYLSSFLTLQPGDMISTGTPKGVSNVNAGDRVVVEVEGVGRLENYIISDDGLGHERRVG